jgi:Fe-Mn family superoxide dismutase
MSDTTRREFMQSSAAALLVAQAAHGADAGGTEPKGTGQAFTDTHTPVALPFDPKSLKGLSEGLIQSHWQNNYSGAVKALNAVRARLSQALQDQGAPPWAYAGLKREQLVRTGSVVLHELYFGNLGGDGRAPASVRSVIGRAFGSFDAWQTEFHKIGEGLSGGSGWVVLAKNRHLGTLENYWMADHATGPVDATPILVMDMYEHAYQMDYGAAAVKYIDAFFANVQWDKVAERLSA